MFKNTSLLVTLLLITVAVNAAVVRWLYPNSSSVEAPVATAQLDQVLKGVQQQSDALSTLKTNVEKLNSEIRRIENQGIEAQTNQQDALTTLTNSLAGLQANLEHQQAATTPDETPATALDEYLATFEQKIDDLQQQTAVLRDTQNRMSLYSNPQSEANRTPDPYAGMSQEQKQQQQELERQQLTTEQQQKVQELESHVSTATDFGRTSQIAGRFEAHLNNANISIPQPQVDCSATLCRFQFSAEALRTNDGEEIDPMLTLMESGTFPADGRSRNITVTDIPGGGVNLYIGNPQDPSN